MALIYRLCIRQKGTGECILITWTLFFKAEIMYEFLLAKALNYGVYGDPLAK